MYRFIRPDDVSLYMSKHVLLGNLQMLQNDDAWSKQVYQRRKHKCLSWLLDNQALFTWGASYL